MPNHYKIHWTSVKKVNLTWSKSVYYLHFFFLLVAGLSTQTAAERALEYMEQRVGGAGGVIAINNTGEIGKHFTTERMPWATISEETLEYGIEPKDHYRETMTKS